MIAMRAVMLALVIGTVCAHEDERSEASHPKNGERAVPRQASGVAVEERRARGMVSPEEMDPLRSLLAKADMVALGTIVRIGRGVWLNDNAVPFPCEFRASQICKGSMTLEGETINVIIYVPVVDKWDPTCGRRAER